MIVLVVHNLGMLKSTYGSLAFESSSSLRLATLPSMLPTVRPPDRSPAVRVAARPAVRPHVRPRAQEAVLLKKKAEVVFRKSISGARIVRVIIRLSTNTK